MSAWLPVPGNSGTGYRGVGIYPGQRTHVGAAGVTASPGSPPVDALSHVPRLLIADATTGRRDRNLALAGALLFGKDVEHAQRILD